MYHELINKATQLYPFLTEHTNIRYIPHFHEETELVYVIDGELELSLNAHSFTIKRGDICIIPQGFIHNLNTHTYSKTFVIKFFPYVDLEYLNPIYNIISEGSVCYDSILKHITDIIDENKNKTSGYELAVNISINSIVLTFLRNFKHHKIKNKINTKHMSKSTFLNSVNEFLNLNFANDLKLCEISKHFNYTSSYFCRHFKKITGISFWEYYTAYRLEKAIELIKTTPNEKITVIATMSGFNNVRSFNQAFKGYYRCTPSEYRKMIIN